MALLPALGPGAARSGELANAGPMVRSSTADRSRIEMLAMKSYSKYYIQDCRARVEAGIREFRKRRLTWEPRRGLTDWVWKFGLGKGSIKSTTTA